MKDRDACAGRRRNVQASPSRPIKRCTLVALMSLASVFLAAPTNGFAQKDVSETLTQIADLQAIGRINVAGYNRRSHCTGALVAPQKVLTAAHCLRSHNGKPIRVSDIHFLPGADRGAYLAHGRAACVAFLKDQSGLAGDAAVIHLREPININALPIVDAKSQTTGQPYTLVGYPRRRPHRAHLEPGCEVVGRRGDVLLTNCRAEPGMSGGPMLGRASSGAFQINAIAVAVAKNGWTLALPAERWRALIDEPCVAAPSGTKPSTPPAREAPGSAGPR